MVGPWTDSGDGTVEKLHLQKVWLQLHYIPRGIVEDSRVKAIGLMAGDIVNDQPKIQTGVEEFTRVQVILDIRQSLTTGLFVTVEGGKEVDPVLLRVSHEAMHLLWIAGTSLAKM
uniref:DUF4283 domain-containing protein n=1 Tax=Nelumbo nucifera TaxID=4432 RepID=A0A822YH97_NELNU|nr:TPA_asm: hypothetical protein HUJ06_012415 [Nelumbo nucifera]